MDYTKSTPQEVVVYLGDKLPEYPLPPSVSSMDDYVLATEYGSKVSKAKKEIENICDHFSKPHYNTYKTIRGMFAPFVESLEVKEKAVKKMMLEFNALEQKRLDEEQKRIEAEALEKAVDGEEVVVPVVNDIKTVEAIGGKSQIRTLTKWKVADITQVPVEFLTVNEKLVDEAVKSGRIPAGIEVYKENTLAFKR